MYWPGGTSRGSREAAALRLAHAASASGSMLAHVGRVGFGPAGGIGIHHGDGKFRARLLDSAAKGRANWPAPMPKPRGKNAGGGLRVLLGDAADAWPRRARDRCGVAAAVAGKIAIDLRRYFCGPGMGSRSGILRLAARERGGGGHHAAQRFVVGLVGGGASRAAVEDGAHGNAAASARRRSDEWCCWRSASARRRRLRFRPRSRRRR